MQQQRMSSLPRQQPLRQPQSTRHRWQYVTCILHCQNAVLTTIQSLQDELAKLREMIARVVVQQEAASSGTTMHAVHCAILTRHMTAPAAPMPPPPPVFMPDISASGAPVCFAPPPPPPPMPGNLVKPEVNVIDLIKQVHFMTHIGDHVM